MARSAEARHAIQKLNKLIEDACRAGENELRVRMEQLGPDTVSLRMSICDEFRHTRYRIDWRQNLANGKYSFVLRW